MRVEMVLCRTGLITCSKEREKARESVSRNEYRTTGHGKTMILRRLFGGVRIENTWKKGCSLIAGRQLAAFQMEHPAAPGKEPIELLPSLCLLPGRSALDWNTNNSVSL
jgi:hypothetical protein